MDKIKIKKIFNSSMTNQGGDTTSPTVTITCAQSSPSAVSPLNFTFTFSEVVTGFALGDITVGNGVASNFAGSGAVYICDVTPAALGAVTVDVAANVAQDAAGNLNTAATQFSITVQAYVIDAFTGTNDTPLASHAPDVDYVGGGWSVPAGTIQINTNAAKGIADPAFPGNIGIIETGAADVVVQGNVKIGATLSGLFVRYVDASNYILVYIQNATPDKFVIRKVEAGVSTDLVTANPTISIGTFYTIRVVLSGSNITATLDGGNQIVASTSFNQTATKHGLELRGSTDFIDTFSVTSF